MDSIAYFAKEAYISKDAVILPGDIKNIERKIRIQLKYLTKAALLYEKDQIVALKVIEDIYCKAAQENNSLLCKDKAIITTDITSRVYNRIKGFKEKQNNLLNLKGGLQNALEEILIEPTYLTHTPPSGTRQVYHQQIKKSHTTGG